MRNHRIWTSMILVAAAAAGWACGKDSINYGGTSNGVVHAKLTDAPFPTDSVDSVTVFVTRVDIRAAAADSANADSATTSDSLASHGWITIASPAKAFNLVSLRNGATADLGFGTLAAGHYSGLRLVIDPSRSSVVLKNGMRLTGTSSPNVTFPSGSSSGLKVTLGGGLDVVAGDTTTMTLDFVLDQSFVLRGNSITQLGLLFKPVIQASVTQ